MLKRYQEAKVINPVPGVTRRTLHYGDKLLMVEIIMEKDATVDWHSHPYEQIGTVISGRLLTGLGEQQQEARSGDSWLFPAGIPHMATALERSVLIEAFSPPREDYKD